MKQQPDVVARLVTQQQHATNLDYANLYMVNCSFLYLVASPLHLPVVRAPTQRLSAENLPPEVETFWMVRRVQVLGLQRSFTTSIWQLQVAIGRVWIQGGFKPNWKEKILFQLKIKAKVYVSYLLLVLYCVVHLHFSISPLVFGSGFVETVVAGWAEEEKWYVLLLQAM